MSDTMLTDKDTWHQRPRTRLVHAVWHGAVLAMERAVQQLADAGENRQSLQLAHYVGCVGEAAARHLDLMVSAPPANGHDKISIAGVDSALLNPARESTEPANGHGTNAVLPGSAANGIGATCAGAESVNDIARPASLTQPRSTVEIVDAELEALASLKAVFAADPQAFEVALKFMEQAHSLASRGNEDAALKKVAAAKNVLRGGEEV